MPTVPFPCLLGRLLFKYILNFWFPEDSSIPMNGGKRGTSQPQMGNSRNKSFTKARWYQLPQQQMRLRDADVQGVTHSSLVGMTEGDSSWESDQVNAPLCGGVPHEASSWTLVTLQSVDISEQCCHRVGNSHIYENTCPTPKHTTRQHKRPVLHTRLSE